MGDIDYSAWAWFRPDDNTSPVFDDISISAILHGPDCSTEEEREDLYYEPFPSMAFILGIRSEVFRDRYGALPALPEAVEDIVTIESDLDNDPSLELYYRIDLLTIGLCGHGHSMILPLGVIKRIIETPPRSRCITCRDCQALRLCRPYTDQDGHYQCANMDLWRAFYDENNIVGESTEEDDNEDHEEDWADEEDEKQE